MPVTSFARPGPSRARWITLLTACILAAPRAARADDASCIAAIEAEATLQKQVKLHAALEQAATCADPSCPAEIRAECGQRILKLNAAMPTVILSATDPGGNDLVAVRVTLDGAPLAASFDGRAIAIDPGSHVLRFEAEGAAPVEKTILLREAEKDRHVAVVLGAPGLAAPAPTAPGAGPTPRAPWSTQRSLALALGGIGLVGIGVGTGFGVSAMSSWSTATTLCRVTSCPATSRGRAESAHDSAVTAGDVSTAAFVVGGAAIAGGVALWLLSPHGEGRASAPAPVAGLRLAPLVGTDGVGVMASGRFP